MLAYAPRAERRRLNSPALALIVTVHAIALLAVLSAKMDAVPRFDPPIKIIPIREPAPPEPPEPRPQPRAPAPRSTFSTPQPVVDPPLVTGPLVQPLPPPPDPGPAILPNPRPVANPPIARSGPRFATAEAEIRPPYPESKRARDEETVLKLRLSIDERGRVVAVDPVGKADAVFLAAARRHILRAWRYKPAMEGERAIASTTIVSLEFRLD